MVAGKTAGNILTAAGSVMIVSALGLLLFNIRESGHAGTVSYEVVQSFISHTEEMQEESEKAHAGYYYEPGVYGAGKSDDTEEESSYFEKDGIRFSAVLTLPAIDTELPVCSSFSMELMKDYPCMYSGTSSGNDLIIAAHNYDSHFGRIKNLQYGDEILLTDASGKVTLYTVTETEVLSGKAVDEMKSGSWDLTLFTCDLSGRNRIAVRCIRKY